MKIKDLAHLIEIVKADADQESTTQNLADALADGEYLGQLMKRFSIESGSADEKAFQSLVEQAHAELSKLVC
jgi:hypothetical protein